MGVTRSILVVDDDAAVRRLYAQTLRFAGYRVTECEDAGNIVDVVRRQQPDVVVMDLMLPGMDGCDACALIKSDVIVGKTRIIVVSSHDGERVAGQALQAGAEAFLSKPVRPEQLLAAVEGGSGPRTSPSLWRRVGRWLKPER